MSNLAQNGRFGQAELPSRDLQQLHVFDPQAADLGALATLTPQLGLAEIEVLAEASHNRYMLAKKAQGYEYGDPRDDHSIPKKHPLMRKFELLPAHIQEANRLPIRAALVTLGALGYRLAHCGTGLPELTSLSQLSRPDFLRAEHNRWLRERLQSGWDYAENTADEFRLHRDVAHFADLPPGEEALDEMVYQTVLEGLPKLGFALVKPHS